MPTVSSTLKVIEGISGVYGTGANNNTPVALAQEMIDKLDVDWSNPNLTIFDPACGYGTFLIIAYGKLREHGHSPKHIVENMLYGNDIDKKKATIAASMLSKLAENDTTIYNEDALAGGFDDMQFDVVLANPPYDNTLHLDFLTFATTISNKIVFLQPAGYLLSEGSKNRNYIKILDRLDNHVSSVILNDPKSWFPNIALNGQQLGIVYIDMEKTYDTVSVEYRQMNKTVKLNSIREINVFANNPIYDSIKNKILDAAFDLSLKDVFERVTSKKYSIEIGDLANYCFFGELKGKGGGGGIRKVEENKSFTGVSFDNKELADAAFSYLKNPIAILALHIAKKNFHVHPSMHTTPWFKDKESFMNPGVALGLTEEEIEFCQEVYNNSNKYFRF